MKLRLLLPTLALLLPLLRPLPAADKKSFELDAAKLATVKRVAVVSVYAPPAFTEGLQEKIELQAFVDSAEATVAAGLRQAGYEVVSGEPVKAAVKSAFAPAYLDFAAADFKKNNRRASDADIQKVRAQIEASGMLRFAAEGRAAVSANSTLVYGEDVAFGHWTLEASLDGTPNAAQAKKATYAAPTLAGLAAVAQAVNADAFLIVRAWPGLAKVAQPKPAQQQKQVGLFPAIQAVTDTTKQMKALGKGKYGAAILDVGLFGRDGSRIFTDQVIGRSKEEEGSVATAFKINKGVGASKAVPLMKEALDSSLSTAMLHLTGKPLAPDTAGLGLASFATPVAGGAAPAAAASSADLTGRYVLTAVNGKPVPAVNENQVTFHSGTLVLNADSTYANDTVYSGGPKGAVGASSAEKTQSVKGKYTAKAGGVALSPEGGMLVKMTAPKNGEISGDSITLFPGAYTYTREGAAPANAK